MSRLVQRVSADGIHLPKALLEQCGGAEGREMIIELEPYAIHIIPAELNAEEIKHLAATYVFEHIGDAAAVDTPQQWGDHWVIPVVLPHKRKWLGQLTFSLNGEWLAAESDAAEVLRDRADED